MLKAIIFHLKEGNYGSSIANHIDLNNSIDKSASWTMFHCQTSFLQDQMCHVFAKPAIGIHTLNPKGRGAIFRRNDACTNHFSAMCFFEHCFSTADGWVNPEFFHVFRQDEVSQHHSMNQDGPLISNIAMENDQYIISIHL